MATEIARGNVASVKVLRSLTGKAQSIASLLFAWRPFVQMLYAALYSTPAPDEKGPPVACAWVKQIGTFYLYNPSRIAATNRL